MRFCPACSTSTAATSAPIEKVGLGLGCGGWIGVAILACLWLIPGVILFVYLSQKKRWRCPHCGAVNRVKG
jgi:hypothetical protein